MSGLFSIIEPGLHTSLGGHTFQRDEIMDFARKYDPQRFHVSEEAARDAMFGALCASGWHTLAVWMRLNVLNGRDAMRKATGYSGEMVFGVSPGARNLRWPHPVFVGDTISYEAVVTGKRETTGREGWGMVMSKCTGTNQDGALVCSYDGAVTMPVR